MDTSKEYIRMCEKAKEIQESYQDFKRMMKAGDFQVYTDCPEVFIWPEQPKSRKPTFRWSIIWLPRQDQLQEILIEHKYSWCDNKEMPHALIWDFSSFIQYHKELTSMEQLWLAFVMKEKYQKTWGGERWIPHQNN